MDFSDIFRMVNLGVGALVVLGGVMLAPSLESVVSGVFIILFGLATILLEFQIPPQVTRYASFMFSFLGRGLFYIFIGSIVAGPHWSRWIIGSAIGLVGLAYTALEYIPSIEPPANMRDADAGWGAEQV
ncbi:golgi apparatus membrane protein tvp15-like protein [Tothia fuscella]|uniref:Golgi apparatus membrane protein tvp15-like protein n=1 Tax=Tothia fuscella TaxID=1048955 RepID=A0A9P4NWD7_9PEZI|nr:golgi apparatus membrane protein tvp15-like protein [Tothia fuscella]